VRTLVINKQNLFYALFVGREPAVDAKWRKTGEYVKTYSSPTQISMNVSPARGIAEHDMFGVELDYDRSMVTDDLDCPIDEHSAVWIFDNPRVAATAEVVSLDDETIQYDGDKTTFGGYAVMLDGVLVPPNYSVIRVAKSLNHITYALREVDIRG
jgi:hypothetical protein